MAGAQCVDERLQCGNEQFHARLDRNGKPKKHEGKSRQKRGMGVKEGKHLGKGKRVKLDPKERNERQDEAAGKAQAQGAGVGAPECVEIKTEEKEQASYKQQQNDIKADIKAKQ